MSKDTMIKEGKPISCNMPEAQVLEAASRGWPGPPRHRHHHSCSRFPRYWYCPGFIIYRPSICPAFSDRVFFFAAPWIRLLTNTTKFFICNYIFFFLPEHRLAIIIRMRACMCVCVINICVSRGESFTLVYNTQAS